MMLGVNKINKSQMQVIVILSEIYNQYYWDIFYYIKETNKFYDIIESRSILQVSFNSNILKNNSIALEIYVIIYST